MFFMIYVCLDRELFVHIMCLPWKFWNIPIIFCSGKKDIYYRCNKGPSNEQ